ncbi:MAG: hypothetical protein U0S36_15095 [Candidatus Nanopelagicales bacterium]
MPEPDAGVLPRPSLVARLLSPGSAAVVAPGGYGKSTLLAEAAVAAGSPVVDVVATEGCDAPTLVWLMSRAARRRGAAGLAGALAAAATDDRVDQGAVVEHLAASAHGSGLTVVVDEVGRLDDVDAVSLLSAIVAACGEPAEGPRLRLLLGGRVLPAAIAAAVADRLEADDLALTPDEVRRLVRARTGDEAGADAVWQRTGGWPAAVAVDLTRGGTAGTPAAGPSEDELEVVVRGPVARTSLRVPRELASIAALPLLSPGLVDRLGGRSSWESLAEQGVPTRERGDGWWLVPDPVRDALAAAGAHPSQEQSRTAAGAYADDGLVSEAVAELLRADDTHGVAGLLSALPWTGLDALSVGELRAVEEVIGDAAAEAHPRALLHLAWAGEHQAEVTLVARCLDRLERLVPDDGSALRLLVLAEQARSAVRSADLERTTALAEKVRAATTTVGGDRDLATARGRATYAAAIALLYDVTPERLSQGDALLTEAAGLLRLAGAPRWESQAWLGLGFGVDLNAGRFGRATERIARGLALLPAQDAARARMLTFLVEVLGHLPRLDEAEAAGQEAVSIAERYADHHLSAYAHWALAWVAARRRDLPRLRARLERVELDLGDWYDLPAGVLFHADAAEMLGDCGDADGAAEHLRRGRARADVAGRDDLLVLPSTLWEARYGDARAAYDAIAALSPRPRERWRYALVQAWCAHRTGDDVTARALVERARAEAEVLGHPETVAVVEPELARWADELLGPDAASEPDHIAVVLLGPVRVHRGDVDLTPPPGHATELLALLAVRGATHADAVAAELWPDADGITARRRLRNLLNRLRSASGDVVARDRDDRLLLAPDVAVDLLELRRAVTAVQSSPAPERAGAARAALRLVEPLERAPGGAVRGAVGEARAEGAALALALLDLVIEAAVDVDDLDDAAALASRACALAPGDEQRLLLLASVLRDAGRLPAAREALAASLRLCAELGVPASVAHGALARSLGVALAP